MYISCKVVWCYALFWITQINSISPKALGLAVNDIGPVVSLIDRIAGSALGDDSKAVAGEDLVAMVKFHLQVRNPILQGGNYVTKRMRHCISSMPLSTVALGDSVTKSLQQLNNVVSRNGIYNKF